MTLGVDEGRWISEPKTKWEEYVMRHPLRWPRTLRNVLVSLVAAAGLALTPVAASAAFTTSQIGFDDDLYTTNSVFVQCVGPPTCQNQNGVAASNCFPTPNTFTHFYNWWWVGTVTIFRHTTSDCSGSPIVAGGQNFTIGASNPNPWFCIDVPQQGGFQC